MPIATIEQMTHDPFQHQLFLRELFWKFVRLCPNQLTLKIFVISKLQFINYIKLFNVSS